MGPRKTLFMDEISTGLDSSTTFQIVNCMLNFVHQMEATVLMSLLQPAPETFELFDDLILLSEGHIIYQGPIEKSLEFFQTIGFTIPSRKGVADFLQEVIFDFLYVLKFLLLIDLFGRYVLERIRNNTGLTKQSRMFLFLLQRLLKSLENLNMEGLSNLVFQFPIMIKRCIIQLLQEQIMLFQNGNF